MPFARVHGARAVGRRRVPGAGGLPRRRRDRLRRRVRQRRTATTLTYGYNNDFLAYFPLDGRPTRACCSSTTSTRARSSSTGTRPDRAAAKTEPPQSPGSSRTSVGNSILHVKRGDDGGLGGRLALALQPPHHGDRPGARVHRPARRTTRRIRDIGQTARLGNCSGGITPWGTALSCEENYDGYAARPVRLGPRRRTGTTDDINGDGATRRRTPRQVRLGLRARPLRPDSVGRKHTALGRFRHENTAFRHVAGQAVRPLHGRRQGQRGRLQVRLRPPFQPGRRGGQPADPRGAARSTSRASSRRAAARSTASGDTGRSPRPSGTGTWVRGARVRARRHRARSCAPRVARRGVRHALRHQPPRGRRGRRGRQRLHRADQQLDRQRRARLGPPHRSRPATTRPRSTFAWEDFAAGGPTGRAGAGEQGFSSPRQPRLRHAGNLWVVTDISSSSLNKPGRPYEYHAQQRGVHGPDARRRTPASRSASRTCPVEAEGTGPYFTPGRADAVRQRPAPGRGDRRRAPTPSSATCRRTPRGGRRATGPTDQNPSTPLPVAGGGDAGSSRTPRSPAPR